MRIFVAAMNVEMLDDGGAPWMLSQRIDRAAGIADGYIGSLRQGELHGRCSPSTSRQVPGRDIEMREHRGG